MIDSLELTRVTAVLNGLHADLVSSEQPLLAVAPELSAYRSAMAPYSNGYAIASLEEAGMVPDTEGKRLLLSSDALAAIFVSSGGTTEHRDTSAMLYALHETFHVVQGVPNHAHVRRIKSLGASWLVSFLDLRSTLHATNLLSDLLAMRTGLVTPGERREVFRTLWTDVGHASLRAFPIYNNPSKCQRYLGHLLISSLLLEPHAWSWWTTRHLLWPVWSANEDELLILSNDLNVLVVPSDVPRRTLRGAVECLCRGDIDAALHHAHALIDSLQAVALTREVS